MLKRTPKPEVKTTDVDRIAIEIGKKKSGSENHAKSAWQNYIVGGKKGVTNDEK